MKQSLLSHGLFKGLAMSLFRLCRCNPFFEGGADPVPLKNKKGSA